MAGVTSVADAADGGHRTGRLPLHRDLGTVRRMRGRGRIGHRTVLAILIVGLLGAGTAGASGGPPPGAVTGTPPGAAPPALSGHSVAHRTPAPASAADLAV